MLGRIHTFEQFEESFRLARAAGFNNINVDLMSAIPGQTEATLENTFDKVTALQPEHISAYSLILEEGTYLADNIDKFPPVPDEEEDRRMYHITKQILGNAGYERYEISNYSRPGFECGIIFCIGTEESIMALGVRQQDLQRMCGIPT